MLIKYLEKNLSDIPLKDKSIIELGSGTGLVGIAVGILGGNLRFWEVEVINNK